MNQETFNEIVQTQVPIAWFAGVRLESANENETKTYVELDFVNQNPFKSMFWAVEGMAAEFAGGMMLLSKIERTRKSLASLVIKNEGHFTKKAVGKIVFSCSEGKKIDQAIAKAIDSKESVLIELTTLGTDEIGDEVARFLFTWSIKLRE
ncbi:thioesterase [Myroides odoratus]|uniref:thioesterase n=1 Tax=Myroides odoratus TaxID=256 RepID=UPI0039B0CB71